MKPFWVTFYSYKGGVGRSLALANTAALLAMKGRKVVLIDFDLEAPGLDSFSEFSGARGKPGVVEYVSEFARRKAAPKIENFIHRCAIPSNIRGELWLMPAGRKDAAYNHQLAHINWAELYDSGLGGPFFDNWKAEINDQYAPDVVFVDSRTGLTEIGGVCTTQFPDLVLMLFGLNEQNIQGTATVAHSIREAIPDRIPQIHFVASPVPNLPSEQRSSPNDKSPQPQRGLLAERMEAASNALGVKITSRIRYFPPAALNEKLFVFGENYHPHAINQDYNELCDKIVEFNRTGLDFLIGQANEAIDAGDVVRIERLTQVLNRDFGNRAEAIFLNSRFALARNDVEAAVLYAERAFAFDPIYRPAAHFLTSHYDRAGRLADADLVYSRLLSFAERFSPEQLSDYSNSRGHILMALGRFAEAEKCYITSARLEEKNGEPAALRMANIFNLAEAHRRATGLSDDTIWRSIVNLYIQSGASSDSPLPQQANHFQAIHIAYALTGDLAAAKDALKKSLRAANAVGEIEDIFSVKSYRNISVANFIGDTTEMLAALETNKLWDGTKLAN